MRFHQPVVIVGANGRTPRSEFCNFPAEIFLVHFLQHQISLLSIEDLICFVKKLVGNLMLFDNLDYNFSLLQHMFKKAKELSDEKVFLLHHNF